MRSEDFWVLFVLTAASHKRKKGRDCLASVWLSITIHCGNTAGVQYLYFEKGCDWLANIQQRRKEELGKGNVLIWVLEFVMLQWVSAS